VNFLHPHDDTHAYQFCPRCGGALERRLLKATEPERPVCTRCGFIFYLDPKIAVGTIIATDSGRLALVRRAIEPGYGKWVFPGGYVDRGEPLTTAAIREAREECGLDVRLDGLVNIYSYAGRAPVIVVYAATAIGGQLCVDDECLETREFETSSLPWDLLAFRSTADGLRDYLAGLRHPIRNQACTLLHPDSADDPASRRVGEPSAIDQWHPFLSAKCNEAIARPTNCERYRFVR
jgi:ADP-ribose pyrophosphatase YjhB (NUDIX family)